VSFVPLYSARGELCVSDPRLARETTTDYIQIIYNGLPPSGEKRKRGRKPQDATHGLKQVNEATFTVFFPDAQRSSEAGKKEKESTSPIRVATFHHNGKASA